MYGVVKILPFALIAVKGSVFVFIGVCKVVVYGVVSLYSVLVF